MAQVVKSALVIAKAKDGSDVYVYAGAPLPDGLADGEAKRLAEFCEDVPDTDSASADVSAEKGFAGMKVDELKAAITARNEGREEADLISLAGVKADLIAALEADDNK